MKMLTVFLVMVVLLTLASCEKQEEELVTAKVLGIHEFELSPGVDPEEYEEYVIETMNLLTRPEGLKVYVLKGDQGEREGKYIAIYALESVELRDRYWPASGEQSEEMRQWYESHAAEVAKGREFRGPAVSTDYVMVEK